jgi:hypothetical protein
MVFRFAGFELDQQRDGVKLRPKAFRDAAPVRREPCGVLGKQGADGDALAERSHRRVQPLPMHPGLRAAPGDDPRQMIKPSPLPVHRREGRSGWPVPAGRSLPHASPRQAESAACDQPTGPGHPPDSAAVVLESRAIAVHWTYHAIQRVAHRCYTVGRAQVVGDELQLQTLSWR